MPQAIGTEICGLADRRAAARGHAPARVCVQPLDDLGPNRGALPRGVRRGAAARHRVKAIARRCGRARRRARVAVPPQMQLGHLVSMCDDTGLFQHAVHSVPDRSHGYCVDDNARALLVACALNAPGEQRLPEVLTARFAAFVQHAWNPDARTVSQLHELRSALARRHGFRGQPRTHALGAGRMRAQRCQPHRGGAGRPRCSPRRRRRWSTFDRRAPGPSRCSDWTPRVGVAEATAVAVELRHRLAAELMRLLSSVETQEWVWFEEELAYDNARLPQALIVTGMSTEHAGLCRCRPAIPALAHDGCRPPKTGLFRPVGSESFGDKRSSRGRSISSRSKPPRRSPPALPRGAPTAILRWKADAQRAFAWFLGSNDLSSPLVDLGDRQLPRRPASRTAPTRTGAASPSSPTCSASPRSASSHARTATSRERARLRALRARTH